MKKNTNIAVQEMAQHYERCVWFARKPPKGKGYWLQTDEAIRDAAYREMDKFEEDYPEEVKNLKDPRTGDWQHGFNSGILAALRFVLTAEHDSLKDAREFFPELDT